MQSELNFEVAEPDDFDFVEFPRDRLERQFSQFHKSNPKVYELCEKFTAMAIAKGFRNFGMQMILERIRWETSIETNSKDGLKVNNNYAAYYARLIVRNHPQWSGFFRNRKTKAEKKHAL